MYSNDISWPRFNNDTAFQLRHSAIFLLDPFSACANSQTHKSFIAVQSALQRLSLPVTRSCRNRESAPCNTLKSASSSESFFPRDSRSNFRKSRDPSSKWPLEEAVANNFRSLRPTLFEDTWGIRHEEKSSNAT